MEGVGGGPQPSVQSRPEGGVRSKQGLIHAVQQTGLGGLREK